MKNLDEFVRIKKIINMFTSLWCTLEGLPDKNFCLTAKVQNTRGKNCRVV